MLTETRKDEGRKVERAEGGQEIKVRGEEVKRRRR